MTLTIVGLGPGDIEDLTRKAWRVLKQAKTIYLRTGQHGCAACLPQLGAQYHTFDTVYETVDDFAQVYKTIVARLLSASRQDDVVYAVPGDPMIGESTVIQLLSAAREAGVTIEIVSGVSFVEPSLRLLGIDALDGLQIVDALSVAAMHHPPLNPDTPVLLGQVYSRSVASHVKLTLMNQYPDAFPVQLIHNAGMPNALVEALPLHQIDHSQHISHTTTLFVPALGGMSSFEQLQEVVAHLRAPEGCPWDREQTHLSLRQYLLEETYEVLEALDSQDPKALAEELGDLLLQVVLHTQIAIDDGEFYMSDVISHINKKLIRRHPHVWGDVSVSGAAQVLSNWDALKKQEQAEKGSQRQSLLDGVPKGLPALLQAYHYQDKAAKPGFDWEQLEDVAAKVREELAEVLAANTPQQRAEEIGDLLFVLVNWARWLGVEPETALRQANAKFYRRFRYIEEAAARAGKPLKAYTLAELDAFWNEAKSNGL